MIHAHVHETKGEKKVGGGGGEGSREVSHLLARYKTRGSTTSRWAIARMEERQKGK